MLVPNRNFSSPEYRYGFNGMEKDDEISGNGNSNTSFFRQFNLRLGRAFSLDPVQRAGQTMYSMMSNNPMIMVDPRGDDDYYNENGVYLYTDTKTSTDIRLITQAQFDKIQNNFAEQMADPDHSYINLIDKLEDESRKVTIKVTGKQFKSMLRDSNLKSNKTSLDNPNRRKEQVAALVLDVKKAEIRLQRMDDKNNVYDRGKPWLNVSVNKNKEGNYLWWNSETGDNEHLFIIAIIHTHPYNGKNDPLFTGRISLDPTDSYQEADNRLTQDIGGGNYQIYPTTSENQVDKAYRFKFGTDDLMSTKDLIKNPSGLVKDAIKTFGKDPNRKQNENP